MLKEFRKGDVLAAADLQEIVNAVNQLEAGLPEVVAGKGRHGVGRENPAFYNVTAADAGGDVTPAVAADKLQSTGMMRSLSYGGSIPGKIVAGQGVLPLPSVADWDEVSAMVDDSGQIPLPVYAKAVKDVEGKTWRLPELATGSGFAATLAKCTLPDGTELRLTLYTERGGNKLCFGLECGGSYSGGGTY